MSLSTAKRRMDAAGAAYDKAVKAVGLATRQSKNTKAPAVRAARARADKAHAAYNLRVREYAAARRASTPPGTTVASLRRAATPAKKRKRPSRATGRGEWRRAEGRRSQRRRASATRRMDAADAAHDKAWKAYGLASSKNRHDEKAPAVKRARARAMRTADVFNQATKEYRAAYSTRAFPPRTARGIDMRNTFGI